MSAIRTSTAPLHPTDEQLAAALGKADADALQQLHRRYASTVFTLAAKALGSSAAEDVVQDVFLILWQKHRLFDPTRGTFRSWFLQIARNRIQNQVQRGHVPVAGSEDVLASLADDAPSPDELEWQRYRQQAVREAVGMLPVAQRNALTLAFFDDLTHDQVATLLQTPLGTAKTRIRGAMKRLLPVLSVVATFVAAWLWIHRERDQRLLAERALSMVTASEGQPLRLTARPGVPPAAHGHYHWRAAMTAVVVNTSGLPRPGRGEQYRVWARHGRLWEALGAFTPDAEGRSLTLATTRAGEALPDEVEVTRETSTGDAGPRGPVVLEWPSHGP